MKNHVFLLSVILMLTSDMVTAMDIINLHTDVHFPTPRSKSHRLDLKAKVGAHEMSELVFKAFVSKRSLMDLVVCDMSDNLEAAFVCEGRGIDKSGYIFISVNMIKRVCWVYFAPRCGGSQCVPDYTLFRLVNSEISKIVIDLNK